MRWLIAVADHGSFAKAADALGVSQPNLSTSLARLEDRLGGKLFHRTPLGSELTPFGELILGRVKRVVADIDEIREDARLIARGELGVVRVGLGAMLPKQFAIMLTSQLAHAHPTAHLQLSVLERERLLTAVRTRELDVAVCAEGEGFEEGELVATPVLSSEILAVAAPDHPLACGMTISPDEFYRYPCAGISIPAYRVPKIIGGSPVVPTCGLYEANAYHLLLPLVLSGASTLVAPHYVVAGHLNAGRLVQLGVQIPTWVRFHAIARRAANPMLLVQSTIELAQSIGQTLESAVNAPAPRVGFHKP